MNNKLKNIVNIEKDRMPLNRNDILLISAFFGLLFGWLLYFFFGPNYFAGQAPKVLTVKKGATLETVIDSLYKDRIIPNKFGMRVSAFIYGAESNIKAGKYLIPSGMSYMNLLDLLIKGVPSEQKLVTIPEGIWQKDLASLLHQQLGLDSAKIMKLSKDKKFLRSLGIRYKKLEGYLLPDTYYFFLNMSEEDVLRKLKTEMDKIFSRSDIKKQMRKLGMTKHDILTLASIIDGESNVISEFKRISGVYHNRLHRGMKLQADPTIQYLLRNKKRHNKIYYKDLEIDSPYNTYKYRGLPPGPINNPGKEAIMAALFPEKNNYYYFVADGSGGHVFAKSLSQHLRNVRKYRRWRRRQNYYKYY